MPRPVEEVLTVTASLSQRTLTLRQGDSVIAYYYIHGTGDIKSLGTAASHGCIRMDPEQAAEVAKYVMLHGGKPREENWCKRILHFRRQEETVHLDKPILIVVTD